MTGVRVVPASNHRLPIRSIGPITSRPGAEAFAPLHEVMDLRFPGRPAASERAFGEGRIAGIYLDLGGNYAQRAATLHRDLLSTAVGRLFPEQMVQVEGSRLVHVTVNRLGGHLAVNLVNLAGQHADRRRDQERVPGPFGPELPLGAL